MKAPQISLLPCGKRLHLHHGPIDLVIEAFGEIGEIQKSYSQACDAFQTVLSDLVQELDALRSSDAKAYTSIHGTVAQKMVGAVAPHASVFVTPMAAVAGAVADFMLNAMTEGRELSRAYVNNGGDCALYLAPREAFNLGAVADTQFGTIRVQCDDPVRGVATSGWRGRSHSLGIADAVTVLAASAAEADVAATLIANAVDLPGHPAIRRAPASDANPDSDLGARLVTVGVGDLSRSEVSDALDRGEAVARDMKQRGLLVDALLVLKDENRATAQKRILEDA